MKNDKAFQTIIAALAMHTTPEARADAVLRSPILTLDWMEDTFDPGALYVELDLMESSPSFEEWQEEVPFIEPIAGIPNLYKKTFPDTSVVQVFYEDWHGDASDPDDFDEDSGYDIGCFGLICSTNHQVFAAIHALRPYAADAAERMRPWVEHHTSRRAA